MRKSLATPQQGNGRRSMLGFGSAAAKGQRRGGLPEQKKLIFSANRSRMQNSMVGSKRWSSQGSHAMKDQRPLSNRAFQKQLIDDILEFLSETGYPHSITPKILSAPTTKEFVRVFEHLYGCIDNNFTMANKKVEEEVPKILKLLSYPFTISKSAMFAIGSLHSWPTLLGALHWMVDLIKTFNSMDIEQVLFQPSFHDEDPTRKHGKTFIEYYTQRYGKYMRNEDEEEDIKLMKKGLETAIIEDAGCSAEDHEMLREEVEALEQELAALEAESDPLEEAIKTKQILEEKIEHDEITIKELLQEHAVQQKQASNYRRQLEEEDIDYEQLTERFDSIKHKSSEIKRELERLNNESDRLEQQNNEREIRYCRKYDEINSLINEYNDIVKELVQNSDVKQYIGNESLILVFDHNVQDISNTRYRLKSLLTKLAEQLSEDVRQLESEITNKEIEITKMKEAVGDKKEDIPRLSNNIDRLDRLLDDKTSKLKHNTGTFGSIQQQELALENQLQTIYQSVQNEIHCLEEKRLRVEEDGKKLKIEEDDFLQHILTYAKSFQQYKLNVKKGIENLNKNLQSDIQHIDQIQKSYTDSEE